MAAAAAVAAVESESKGEHDSSANKAPDGRIEDSEKMETTEDATDEDAVMPPAQTQGLQRWNESTVNVLRFLGTNYAFVLMGMTDAAVGVRTCIPKRDQQSVANSPPQALLPYVWPPSSFTQDTATPASATNNDLS